MFFSALFIVTFSAFFNVQASDGDVEFFRQFISPGDLVLDIGACVGTKTDLYLLSGAGKVIAVDPQPTCYKVMMDKYKNDPRVSVLALGVSRVAGTARMSICTDSRQLSTLSTEWPLVSRYGALHNNRWDEYIDIKVITLDDIIVHYGIPQFCKLDIENFEYEALMGLSIAIPHICFEFHHETSSKTAACLERLAALGFSRFNFVITDKNRLVSDEWLEADQLLVAICNIGQNNRFGEPMHGDIYACAAHLCKNDTHKHDINRTKPSYSISHCVQRELCASIDSVVQEGDLVFDIGAHAGRRTERYVKAGASVISVEPIEIFCNILRKRYQKELRVTVVNKGVGDYAQRKPFYLCPHSWALATFSPEWTEKSRYKTVCGFEWIPSINSARSNLVEMITLDALIATYGMPQYCKLCISNYESQALNGLTQPIPCISFEFHQEFVDNIAHCLERLYTLGYREFNFTLGSDDTFSIDEWVPLDQLVENMTICVQKRAMGGLCGEIFARVVRKGQY